MTTTVPDYSVVLARFENVVPWHSDKAWRLWRARCPAHADRVNSLSLWIGRNGALVIGCHAGCDKADILRAVGLEMRDLFPDRRPGGEISRVRKQVVDKYDYRDEAGLLLYQTLRYEPKDFRQRRPMPGYPGQWTYNLECVRRVLYRLPELITFAPAPVWIVEGEKDADALHALGLCGTTRAMGAKSPWLPDYSRVLARRAVYVIPDNDAAGRDGAALVAGHLVASGLPSAVCVVHLDGLPEHGDVSDWIAARAACQPSLIRHNLLARAATVYRATTPGIANAG